MEAKQAVVIVSHGSRNLKAQSQFENLTKKIKAKIKYIRIEGAFFQLAQPNLTAVIEQLVQEGFKQLSIVPFFLMHGNHVAHDIPELIQQEQKKYPDVSFTLGSTLCPAESLESLVINRVQEVLR